LNCSFLLLCTSNFAEEKAVSLFDQHFNDYSENLADAIDAKKAGILSKKASTGVAPTKLWR
jgi:hypothetical protein